MENTNNEGNVAAEVTPEKKEKKNATWKYSLQTHVLTVTFPDGSEYGFNLGAHTNGMAASDELMFQYGFKQWLASNAASLAIGEKLEKFKTDYGDFMKSGLELSDNGGNITIIGRVRANGTGGSAAGALGKAVKEITKAVTLQGLTVKKALYEAKVPGAEVFTEEDQKKLDEFIAIANGAAIG